MLKAVYLFQFMMCQTHYYNQQQHYYGDDGVGKVKIDVKMFECIFFAKNWKVQTNQMHKENFAMVWIRKTEVGLLQRYFNQIRMCKALHLQSYENNEGIMYSNRIHSSCSLCPSSISSHLGRNTFIWFHWFFFQNKFQYWRKRLVCIEMPAAKFMVDRS